MPHENEQSFERRGHAGAVSDFVCRDEERVTEAWFAGDPWSNEGRIAVPLRRIIHSALRVGHCAPPTLPSSVGMNDDRGGITGCPDLEVRREQESSFRQVTTSN
jgi:hypothetical protein